MSRVFENELENGVRVVGETIPHFSSVSLGVWIGAGSIYERENEGGISHFIEHMLFKSTKTRTPEQIAVEMDSIGGNLNAFTAKECTCYYAKTLDRDLGTAAEILSDMIHNPQLSDEDIEREKGVVCEEISMTEDSPEDLVHETLCAVSYDGTPISKPIAGTRESVQSFDRSMFLSYMDRLYTPENTVIACAGNVEEHELMNILRQNFKKPRAAAVKAPECGNFINNKRFECVYKDVEQAHIALSLPSVPLGDKLQYPVHVLNNVLGGSMSSRLFQNIREKRGLAYSVYSYTSFYRGTGYLSLYAGTGANQANDVTEQMFEELRAIKLHGITEEEFARSKKQLKNSFLMGQESTTSRSSSLGKSMIIRGRVYSPEEILSDLERVTMDDVYRAIEYTMDFDKSALVLVGKRSGGMDEDKLKQAFMGFHG